MQMGIMPRKLLLNRYSLKKKKSEMYEDAHYDGFKVHSCSTLKSRSASKVCLTSEVNSSHFVLMIYTLMLTFSTIIFTALNI